MFLGGPPLRSGHAPAHRRPRSAVRHDDASWNPELASNKQDRQHYGNHQEDYAHPQTEIKLPHPRIGSIHDRRLIRHGIEVCNYICVSGGRSGSPAIARTKPLWPLACLTLQLARSTQHYFCTACSAPSMGDWSSPSVGSVHVDLCGLVGRGPWWG
jgi:hypothetical protein